MKLRFRADAQDILIFAIFAVFLLYVVALGVVNIPSLASDGHFYGLNPLPAFSPANITVTFVLYILFLVGVFVSVGSYFFEREEGIGFTTAKKDKGYSRWAKEKEIRKELSFVDPSAPTSDVAGVPLILKDNEIWVDNSEYHSLVIGATGSGKTQTVIFPTVELLAKNKESMIITDPKGEIYEQTSNMLRDKGYNIFILNFRDPQQGNSWNPLSLPYEMYAAGNQDKAIELLDDLATNILYEENNGNADPFWEKTSADYFSGLSLGMFEDAKPEEININSISTMTTVGEDRCGGSTYAKEYFNLKDPSSAAYVNASGTVMAPSETKGSIITVFKQKIKLFASRENLSEMLSYSDFRLEEIGEKPTALFIVIQDEKKTYHSLVTILLKQCYETLIATAQKHGGKLPVRTNFLLDEFANMPPLKDITTMITAARSRRIRFTMIIQNFAQLDKVYGKENAETIRGNCGNTIYLITTELKALEEISKMCGEQKSKKDDKTASTPLVTVSDLQRMKLFEVIIMRIRMQPFKTKFTPYFKLKGKFGKEYPKADYPTREKKPIHIFDMKAFVQQKKNEKLAESRANGMPGGFGPGMFGGGMPGMAGMSGMGGMPPMFGNDGMRQQPSALKQPEINYDELFKKIDAKLSALDEEESDEGSSKKIEDNPTPQPEPEQKEEKKVSLDFDAKRVEDRFNNIREEKKSQIDRDPIKAIKLDEKAVEDRLNKMLNEENEENNKVIEAKYEPVVEKPVEEKTTVEEKKIVEQPANNTSKPVPKISLDDEIKEDRFFDDFFDD